MSYSCEHCGRVFETSLSTDGGIDFCSFCDKLNIAILDDAPNIVFGDFIIEEAIGAGGHSIVVKATHTPSGNDYALKLFFTKCEDNNNVSQEFLQEVETASQLVHENIVRIFEGGVHENIMYIVMEHVSGLNLGEYLELYIQMEPKEAVAAMIHACNALDYVWSNFLMIHRDVKPHNIIVTKEGAVKLCDFGLTSNHEMAVQESRNILGTPFYLSPEMIQTDIYQDNRSDIYSLGCTLYHLVVGLPPFNYGGLLEVVNARIENPPPDPRAEFSECPEALAKIIMTMMATESDDRYATAFEVSQDLLRFLKDEDPLLVDPNRERANQ